VSSQPLQACNIIVRVQNQDIDTCAQTAVLTSGRTDIGALVCFTGLCRDEGSKLAALEIEHYPGMAEAEISRVAHDAASRWPISGIIAIHRHGVIRPGETIVFVAAASAHRRAAFEAADFVMDYLKTSAPFWKKQHMQQSIGDWVVAKAEDDDAVARWRLKD
jgi:molybdopterin synthase catalytic subunit